MVEKPEVPEKHFKHEPSDEWVFENGMYLNLFTEIPTLNRIFNSLITGF